MQRLRPWLIVLGGLAALGPPPCGGSPAVVLVASDQVVVQQETFVVRVESRAYQTGEAFSFKVTFPSSKLQLLSTDLAHGPNDLHVMSSPVDGELIVWAANTVDNPSVEEPNQGVILSEFQFLALPTTINHTAQIEIVSAKLGTTVPGNPVVLTTQVNPVRGPPLTIQIQVTPQ